MALTLITPPAEDPMSLAEIKAHLRVTHGDEDALILRMLRAATHAIENRAHVSMIRQSYRLTRDRAPGSVINLPRPPLISVESVAVIQKGGALTPVDDDLYEIDPGRPGRLKFRGALPWTDRTLGSLRIEFTAGFGDDAAAVPPELKLALSAMVAHFYENRDGGDPNRVFTTAPYVDGLIAPYREVRL
jgi:uncharacterized phiE125 gp8 family phage protein